MNVQAGGLGAAALLRDIDADMLKALVAGSGADGDMGALSAAGDGTGGAGGASVGASAEDMLARLQTGLRPIERYAVRSTGPWTKSVVLGLRV